MFDHESPSDQQADLPASRTNEQPDSALRPAECSVTVAQFAEHFVTADSDGRSLPVE
jgi:hypothetical protein